MALRGPLGGQGDRPVELVAGESIRAILPHLSPKVAAMVQLQHLCGAGPRQAVLIRPREVDTGGEVWLYQPLQHKTGHLDRRKGIMLGPRAKAALRPRLERDAGTCCFVPEETSARHFRRARRKPRSGDSIGPVESKSLNL